MTNPAQVCTLLHKLKKHVDDFHDAEEECRRLSVLIEPLPLDIRP